MAVMYEDSVFYASFITSLVALGSFTMVAEHLVTGS
jgi:hypothetical protein